MARSKIELMQELTRILDKQDECLKATLESVIQRIDPEFQFDFELFVRGESFSDPKFREYLETNPDYQAAVEEYFRASLLHVVELVAIVRELSGQTPTLPV